MKLKIYILMFMLFGIGANLFSLDPTKSFSIGQFRNTTQKSDYKWLEVAFGDMISNDLAALKKFPIVTRDQLRALLEEQKLQFSGIIDEKTAIKAGQVSGAGYMLFGDFIILNPSTIRININAVDVETGKNIAASSVTGSPEQIFTLEKLLVVKLLDALSVQLTELEKVSLFQMSTTSIKAIEQNYKGVAALEGNDKASAKKYFEAAVAVDPYYRDAKQNLEKSSLSFAGGSLFDAAIDEIEQKRQQLKAVKDLMEYFMKNLLVVKFDGKPEIVSTNTDKGTVDIAFDWHVEYNPSALVKIYDFFKKLSQNPSGDTEDKITILYPGKVTPETINFSWFKESKEIWFTNRYTIDFEPNFVIKTDSVQVAQVYHHFSPSTYGGQILGNNNAIGYNSVGSWQNSDAAYSSDFMDNESFKINGKVDANRKIVFKGINVKFLKNLTGIELLKTTVRYSNKQFIF